MCYICPCKHDVTGMICTNVLMNIYQSKSGFYIIQEARRPTRYIKVCGFLVFIQVIALNEYLKLNVPYPSNIAHYSPGRKWDTIVHTDILADSQVGAMPCQTTPDLMLKI